MMKYFSWISCVCISVLLVVIGIVPVAIAQSATPFNVLIYTHTRDATVGSAYVNSYSAFQNVPGANVIIRDISGWSFDRYQAQLQTDMIAGQNLLVYGGHGSLTDLSTDGVSFTRDYAMRAASNVAAEKGGTVTGVVESCGSGNCVVGTDLAGSGALEGVYTAANPGDYGWVSNQGGPWYANFGEKFKGALSQFGTGSASDPDVNKDGILTQGELADALYGKNKGNRSQIPDPEAPFKFKDQATEDAYNKAHNKPCSVAPVYSEVPDTEGACYKLENTLYNKDSKAIVYSPGYKFGNPNNAGPVSALCPGPDPTEDKKANAAQVSGGHVVEIGGYTTRQRVNDVLTGKLLVVAGSQSVQAGNETKDQCTFNEIGLIKTSPPPSNQNQGGNNGGGQQAQAPSSGLEALLPALLQSLLGGGQNQGQQNNQNQNGLGNTQPQTCASQGVFPVCGSNGATYTNSCYLQQNGVVQVSTGVCPGTSPIPVSTPDVSKIVTQLVASGTPQGVLNSVIQSLTSLFSHVAGQVVIQ